MGVMIEQMFLHRNTSINTTLETENLKQDLILIQNFEKAVPYPGERDKQPVAKWRPSVAPQMKAAAKLSNRQKPFLGKQAGLLVKSWEIRKEEELWDKCDRRCQKRNHRNSGSPEVLESLVSAQASTSNFLPFEDERKSLTNEATIRRRFDPFKQPSKKPTGVNIGRWNLHTDWCDQQQLIKNKRIINGSVLNAAHLRSCTMIILGENVSVLHLFWMLLYFCIENCFHLLFYCFTFLFLLNKEFMALSQQELF